MSTNAIVRISILAVASMFVFGCDYAPGMLDRTMSYNQAVADSNNSVLLLNIIRESNRYPTYYSRLEGDTAIGTVTPQLQLSWPLSHAAQITRNSTGVSSQITEGAMSFMPQLQAVETNQLQLGSLDDQKYINGMMTPISPAQYRLFQDAGWPSELLGLMMIRQIQIPFGAVAPIETEVHAKCSPTSNYQPLADWCESITDSTTHVIKAIYAEPCFSATASRPSADTPDTKIIVFGSDPANPAPKDQAIGGNKPPLSCFQVALRTLLILGLHAGDAPPKPPKMTVVENGLDASLKTKPKFIGSLLANGYVFGVAAFEKPSYIVVCKSEVSADATGLTSKDSSTSASQGSPGPNQKTSLLLGFRAPPDKSANKSSAEQCVDAYKKTRPPSPSTPTTTASTPSECKFSDGGDSSTVAVKIAEGGSMDDKSKLCNITLWLNSTEGMLYYLSETARVELGGSPTDIESAGMVPTLDERNLENVAVENKLFEVRRGDPPGSELISARYAGSTYYIPAPCESDCSASNDTEHPRHRSQDVITLINQMWGLQKEESTMAAAPAVTVISP